MAATISERKRLDEARPPKRREELETPELLAGYLVDQAGNRAGSGRQGSRHPDPRARRREDKEDYPHLQRALCRARARTHRRRVGGSLAIGLEIVELHAAAGRKIILAAQDPDQTVSLAAWAQDTHLEGAP